MGTGSTLKCTPDLRVLPTIVPLHGLRTLRDPTLFKLLSRNLVSYWDVLHCGAICTDVHYRVP